MSTRPPLPDPPPPPPVRPAATPPHPQTGVPAPQQAGYNRARGMQPPGYYAELSSAAGAPRGRGRRPVLIAGIVLLVVAVGAIVFVLTRSDGGGELAAPFEQPLTARQIALDRSTQADLRNAFVAAKTAYIESNSFDAATPEALAQMDPSLCYVAGGVESQVGACGDAATISVFPDGQRWSAAARSESGTCFWIKEEGGAFLYGAGDPCTGEAAMAATAPAWA